jgi:hypothetical protein
VPLEAHLEGLAYRGTAAAEKTIRSLDPDSIRSDASIANMIRIVKGNDQPLEHREFGRTLYRWRMGTDRGTRHAQLARDLRNDAAHGVYEKAPAGPRWRIRLEARPAVALDKFVTAYVGELAELEQLIASAEELAVVGGAAR